MRIVLGCLVAVGVMTGSADAQTSRAIGAGIASCRTWAANRLYPGSGLALQDGQWILGFLSGVGWLGTPRLNPLDCMNAQAVFAWVETYCHANPLENIAHAGDAFVEAHPR